jgi:hypothetical protein
VSTDLPPSIRDQIRGDWVPTSVFLAVWEHRAHLLREMAAACDACGESESGRDLAERVRDAIARARLETECDQRMARNADARRMDALRRRLAAATARR